MRVLVVGCGYVGLPLGRELVRLGHDVTGLRRRESGRAELVSAGLTPWIADITQPAQLAGRQPDFEAVVSAVSATGGGVPEYRSIYLEGARNLVAWLGRRQPRRFVYTSSTGVYGQTDGSTVDEASLAEPATETARILVQTEQLLRTAFLETAFPAVILRVAGIYGPGRGHWLKQYRSGEARLEGQGSRVLNMVHRDDVVGAIIAALERGQPGETYNVADDEPVTQLTLFEWLARELGGGLPPAVPEDAISNRKRGLTSKRVANLRLRNELNYQLRYPTFRQGFAGL